VIDGGILRDVDGKRRLAHGRAGGDDDQFALLKAAGLAIEVGEIGGQTGHFPLCL